jgi:hypothetical protein
LHRTDLCPEVAALTVTGVVVLGVTVNACPGCRAMVVPFA